MSAPSANDLLSELKFGEYLPEDTARLREEREAIEAAAGAAITSMTEVPTAYRAHVEKVQEFLAVLWKKYDCDDLMEVVRAYTKVEPILLDLERDEAAGGRYRDHSVHSFNVFVFGLRLLSKLIDALGPERAEKSLKVRPERIHERIAGFRDWPYRERLFYLWTLMSTFHDIAIPLEHLGGVSDGLNEFARKFSLHIVGPTLHRDGLYPGLDDYFRRLGAIFKGKVTPDEGGLAYDQAHDDPYVERYLRKKFEDNDHGVLSGLLLYRKVEEIFMLLRGKAKDVFHATETFDHFVRYILQQDIARASLAMSVHNLKRDSLGVPLFLPIRFDHHPLSFILILSDGLQEYLRWEGTSIVGATKFCCFPSIELTQKDEHFELEVGFFLTGTAAEEEYLKQQARAAAAMAGRPVQADLSLNSAASLLLDGLRRELDSQIDLSADFRLVLTISNPQGVVVRNAG